MNIKVINYLQHGYAIVQKEKSSELTLVRMKLDKFGNVYEYKEINESKFQHRLLKEYEKELKINKQLIMNVEETIKNLTIPQLEALLPSYYGLVIERRIKELQEKENAIAKTVRSTKVTTKTRGRKRNLQA
jgi:predicted S18 family serine protease